MPPARKIKRPLRLAGGACFFLFWYFYRTIYNMVPERGE
jgi:hypothetical protein